MPFHNYCLSYDYHYAMEEINSIHLLLGISMMSAYGITLPNGL